MDDDDGDGGQLSESFARASKAQLKTRKRLRIKRGAIPAGSENAPATNAFAGIKLMGPVAPSGALGGLDASKRVTFSLDSGSGAAAAKPYGAAAGASAGNRMRALNASFLRWVKSQSSKNPSADWSAACREYCKYAAKLAAGSSSGAAQGPAATSSFPAMSTAHAVSFSTASPPRKAPTPAPAPAPPAPAAAPAPAASSGEDGEAAGKGDAKKQVDGEEVIYEVRAKLYKWKRGGKVAGAEGEAAKEEQPRWADFGVGMLRFKRDVATDKRWMHLANGVNKTVLNAPLYAALKLAAEGPTTVSFVGPDVEGGVTKHMLRVKTADMLAELKEAFEKHKPKA